MHYNRHQYHHGIHLERRSPPRRPDMIPLHPQPYIILPEEPTFVKRNDVPSNTCAPGDDSNRCEKPASTSSTTTLPVVLGAVIPIVCAIVVLIFLHRRNLKKLRREDANDKHKSLDFGLDMAASKGGKSMRETEKGYNHMKGMSLDIGPSPYMLPPSLRGSKDSLNSLSRSMRGNDDVYRHANGLFGADNGPLRSHPRGLQDDMASIAPSAKRGALGDDMNYGLLGNAQRMSRSSPPLYNSPNGHDDQISSSHAQVNDNGFELNLPRSPSPVFVPGLAARCEPTPTITIVPESSGNISASAPPNTLPNDHQPDIQFKETLLPQIETNSSQTQHPPFSTPRISLPSSDGASDYGDSRESNPVIPAVNVRGVEHAVSHEGDKDQQSVPTLPEEPQSQNLRLDPRRDTRRLTMGLRPLPPEDPSDNPEQRANRIRSFYKEYFEDSKGPEARASYYEDYGPDFYPQDDYVYDPVTGEYFDAVPAPYAEPITRRAMTPPPRAPPRFQGAPRHMATGSMGGFSERFNPGPRAFSSASGRFPGAQAPRRPAPPPSPLTVLPTPHMLKDDAIMSAIDFAPGKNFHDQREGRPETPLGGVRPFSPLVRAHTPLVSSFDELAVIPSPHALRKSGTFDNLDFAPPPRFKNSDTASDAGSIRSNRTGISNAHMYNIRTGAYRVSRLPPDAVGTKDDLMSNLRPTWDMRQ